MADPACCFCKRTGDQVTHLIQGPDRFICDICVAIKDHGWRERQIDYLLRLRNRRTLAHTRRGIRTAYLVIGQRLQFGVQALASLSSSVLRTSRPVRRVVLASRRGGHQLRRPYLITTERTAMAITAIHPTMTRDVTAPAVILAISLSVCGRSIVASLLTPPAS